MAAGPGHVLGAGSGLRIGTGASRAPSPPLDSWRKEPAPAPCGSSGEVEVGMHPLPSRWGRTQGFLPAPLVPGCLILGKIMELLTCEENFMTTSIILCACLPGTLGSNEITLSTDTFLTFSHGLVGAVLGTLHLKIFIFVSIWRSFIEILHTRSACHKINKISQNEPTCVTSNRSRDRT